MSEPGHRIAVAVRVAVGITFVAMTGCFSASDSDGRLVLAEQARIDSLADPATLTRAKQTPVENPPTDHGRWPSTLPTTQATPPATTRPMVELTIEQSVRMALEGNRSLVVQRYAPTLSKFAADASLAPFDPTLTSTISGSRSGLTIAPAVPDFNSITAQAGLQQFFVTGTTVGANLTGSYQGTQLYGDRRDAVGSLRAGLSVTQSLLQGASVEANLVSVRQAQLDVLTSQYELRGVAEQLASDTEQAYIDLELNYRELEIAENALHVAQSQLEETNALIHSGRNASSDRAAALSTVAQRQEGLINARAALEQSRLRFIRLISPRGPGGETAWDAQLHLTQPAMPVGLLEDADAHVRVALVYRSDLNQSRLQVERGNLDVVRTRNGLLPRLDLFATLGRTWYSHYPTAGGFSDPASYDVSAGLNFAYPLFNRAARAAHNSALATRDQSADAIANLTELIQFDVRSSYQEAVRSQQQIAATAATLAANDAALQVEQEKYRVGKSTSLLVSLAQQALLDSKNAQAVAIANYLKGLVDLYRIEGSLLERRGVVSLDYPPRVAR